MYLLSFSEGFVSAFSLIIFLGYGLVIENLLDSSSSCRGAFDQRISLFETVLF